MNASENSAFDRALAFTLRWEGGCGFWCKAKVGALGALVGAVVWEVAR